MPRGKVIQTSKKRSKSVGEIEEVLKSTSDKSAKQDKQELDKQELDKQVNEATQEATDDETDELEFDADEDEFFDDSNFKDFNEKIQFRVFDPEKYETELHKEIIIVPNNYRKTSEVITKFEFTDVVSNRAKQIENGSPVFVDIKDETDPISMAELEIRMKRCPISIRRLISNNIAEIWDVNEMMIPY